MRKRKLKDGFIRSMVTIIAVLTIVSVFNQPLANASGTITITNKHNQTCSYSAGIAWCIGNCNIASGVKLGMAYKDAATGKWVYQSGTIETGDWTCIGEVWVNCDDGKSFRWNAGGVVPICYNTNIDIDFGCCR